MPEFKNLGEAVTTQQNEKPQGGLEGKRKKKSTNALSEPRWWDGGLATLGVLVEKKGREQGPPENNRRGTGRKRKTKIGQ